MTTKGLTRRKFLTRFSAAGGMLVLGSHLYLPQIEAAFSGERIRVGFIGLGRQGKRLMQIFLNDPNVDIAALCDVSQGALRTAADRVTKLTHQAPLVSASPDSLLADKSIDAVVVATPGELLSRFAVSAVKAGKNCYVESPGSNFFYEGQQLVSATKKYDRVVQYGQAADLLSQHAMEIAAVGSIERVKTICFCEFPTSSAEPLRLAFAALHQSVQLLVGALPQRTSTLSAGSPASLTGQPRLAAQFEFHVPVSQTRPTLDFEVVSLNALPPQTMNLFGKQIEEARKQNDLPSVSKTTITGTRGSFSFTQVTDLMSDAEFLVHNFLETLRRRKPQLLASPFERGSVSAAALHLAKASLELGRPVSYDLDSGRVEHDSEAQKLLLGLRRKTSCIQQVA